MKKMIFAILIGLCSTFVFAQGKESKSEKKEMNPMVPEAVMKAFARNYPKTKATWDSDNENFEAQFKFNGMASYATYDNAGHRLSTEVTIKSSQLPAPVAVYLKKNYPKHKVSQSSKMTDDKKVITYEVEIKKSGETKDLMFDSRGKFIKEEGGD